MRVYLREREFGCASERRAARAGPIDSAALLSLTPLPNNCLTQALTRAADATTPSTTTAAWRAAAGGGSAAAHQRRWATNSHDVFNTVSFRDTVRGAQPASSRAWPRPPCMRWPSPLPGARRRARKEGKKCRENRGGRTTTTESGWQRPHHFLPPVTPQHQDSPANNKATPFDFTPANYDRIATLLSHYPSNWAASAMIPVLDLAQQQNDGWLSLSAMNKVAAVLGVPPIRVYEVATFYTMFNRSPMGKLHVMVCGTTPCRLAGAEAVHAALVAELGVDYGGTTPCGTFTLGEMECMGACVNAPMVAVADYRGGVEGFSYLYYEDLTPTDAVAIVRDLKAGKTPKVGSQHRQFAEPVGSSNTGAWKDGGGGGRTSLTFEGSGGKAPGPFCRDLDAPEAQITPPPPPPGAK